MSTPAPVLEGIHSVPRCVRPLTVVVVTYRCRELALTCLRSVFVQELEQPLEVIVVDNDSRDGTVEALRSEFPMIRVVANTDNVGFGRACNQALATSNGDVLLLNPDTVLPQHALRDCLAELARRPRTGMLGPKLVQGNGSIDHACRRAIPTPVSSLAYMLRLHRWLPGSQSAYLGGATDYDSEAVVGAVNGAFMLVRREALDEVGPLDERFWMYGEDLDWCLRFTQAGWDVLYWPGVCVLHEKGGSSGRARTLAVNREFHRAMWLFYAKHDAAENGVAVRAAVRTGIAGKFAASASLSAVRRSIAHWRRGPSIDRSTVPAGPSAPVAEPLHIALARAGSRLSAADPRSESLHAAAAAGCARVVVHEVGAAVDSPRQGATRALIRDVARCVPDIVVLPDSRTGRRNARLLRASGRHVAVLGRDVGICSTATGEHLIAELAEWCGRPGAGRSDGPAVSVVCTVLDEERGVAALVDEVGDQLRPSDELVVIDGGSRDATPRILAQLAQTRGYLKVVHAPGTNISAGRNAGVAVATNRVLAFTDVGCALASGWLDGLRAPFADADPPGLVAGIPRVAAHGALQRAQAIACYPDPDELVHPSLLASLYTAVLGLGFDPRTPFARTLAVSRTAFEAAGGFPERLPWVEDGVFGLAVAKHHRCAVTRHAEVSWTQRLSLRSTVRMYRNYGVGAARSGYRVFWGRDIARALAYAVAIAGATLGFRRPLVLAGAAYVSLPVARALRRHDAGAAVLVPLAMAAKDLGKLYGEACVALGRDVTTR